MRGRVFRSAAVGALALLAVAGVVQTGFDRLARPALQLAVWDRTVPTLSSVVGAAARGAADAIR